MRKDKTVPESKLLARYIKKLKNVDGWLTDDAIYLINTLGHAQIELNVEGHVGEIGIHHGKLFIILYLLMRPSENAVAIDIFENQELSVDKSGKGDYAALLANLETYAKETKRLRVIKADSTKLTSGEIEKVAGGRYRLFSIDGGHTKHITMCDLETVSGALCDGGVIALDDCFNEVWPGVSEGTYQFFSSKRNGKIIPFAIGGNKVFLTTANYAGRYIDHLLQGRGYRFLDRELLGQRVIVYDPHPRPATLKDSLASFEFSLQEYVFSLERYVWQKIKHKPLGKTLAAVLRRVIGPIVLIGINLQSELMASSDLDGMEFLWFS